LKHESGGLLIASRDGGKSFDEVGKGHGPAWVFDDKTAVVAEMKTKDRPRPGLLRTTDGGRTFKPCGAYSTQALPKGDDGTLYWLVDGALLSTGDKGETWKEVGHVQDGRYGPIFGKDAGQMFVLTKDGIAETHDGGTTWSAAVPLPATVRGGGPLTWIEYDPKHDVLYAMKMGSDLFKLDRSR